MTIDYEAEVERLQRERDEARAVVRQMTDTLRAVLVLVELPAENPYPWDGGAFKGQIREDIDAGELLDTYRRSVKHTEADYGA